MPRWCSKDQFDYRLVGLASQLVYFASELHSVIITYSSAILTRWKDKSNSASASVDLPSTLSALHWSCTGVALKGGGTSTSRQFHSNVLFLLLLVQLQLKATSVKLKFNPATTSLDSNSNPVALSEVDACSPCATSVKSFSVKLKSNSARSRLIRLQFHLDGLDWSLWWITSCSSTQVHFGNFEVQLG